MGVWNTQVLEIDIELFDAHRLEADAPEFPALEDIPDSVLPPPPVRRGLPSSRPGMRPGVPSSPRLPPPPRPPGSQRAATSADPTRILEDFVARHRLEYGRAKLILSGLRPEERQYVMSTFRPNHAGKKDPTSQFRDHVETCQKRPSGAGGAGRRPVHGAPPSSAASNRSAIGAGSGANRPVPPRPPSRYESREPPWASRTPASTGSKRPAPTAIGSTGSAKRSRYGDNMPPPPSSARAPPPAKAPSVRTRTPPRGPKPPSGAPPTRANSKPASSASRSRDSERPEASSRRSMPSSVEAAKPGDLIKSLLG